MQDSNLQDANLPAFLIEAVLAGLHLPLQVAQSVGEQLLIQLVVVSLLARQQELLLLSCRLVRFAMILETVMSGWMFVTERMFVFCM